MITARELKPRPHVLHYWNAADQGSHPSRQGARALPGAAPQKRVQGNSGSASTTTGSLTLKSQRWDLKVNTRLEIKSIGHNHESNILKVSLFYGTQKKSSTFLKFLPQLAFLRLL